MFKKNHLGNLVSFCILTFILYSIKPDILPQSKSKITNWPEPVFEQITVEDGLPINSITCMIQDHFGYLWLGTTNGLVKYDGYNMKVYQPDPDDSFSISGEMIRSLYEDKRGTIWIGTRFGGLNSFDRKTEKFTRYDTASIANSFVYCIDEDKDGNILTGTMNGLKLLDHKSNKFRDIYYQTLMYTDSAYKYLLDLKKSNCTISAILKAGDNESLIQDFTLRKKTITAVVTMGELGSDYGWLENANGKIIAGGNNSLNVLAGGVPKSRINITIDTLKKGNYSIHYKSDGSYSYNSWDGEEPPDYEEFWGIQVIKLPNDGADAKEIFKSQVTEKKKQWIRDIIKDDVTNEIYVGSYKVFEYNEEKKLLVPVELGLEQDLGLMNKFCQRKDGIIFIGHIGGLLKYNPLTSKINNYQPLNVPHPSYMQNFITNLVEDEDGFIWCRQFSKGLICFDPKAELFKSYEHDSKYINSISNDNVVSLLVDRSGILWVGTAEGGLNKWDEKKNKLKRITYNPEDPEAKPFDKVYALDESQNGIIWFSTDDGLYSFNPQTNEFQNYRYKTNVEDHIESIYTENPEIIWLGTVKRGLGKFNHHSKTFKFYSHDPSDSTSISGNNVTKILTDSSSVLWVGTLESGLNKFDETTGKFNTYAYDADNPQSIASNFIDCIYHDRSGTMWVATNFEGLNRFNKSTGTFELFHCTMGTALNSLETIYEDRKGNFWVGTYQSGIHLFDRKKGIAILNISQRDGLAFNSVSSILEDDSGRLWIATKNGLSKFDPQTKSIKNYFVSDSPESNNYLCGLKTNKGEMIFGTANGLVMFYPDSVKDDPAPPQVLISNVSLFNKPNEIIKYDGFISEVKELNLSYDQNDLRFDFIGLHYSEPAKNRYKYKLENFDDDWIDAGTQRNATYTNLNPGEYTFRVTACNSDGVWNKKGASIKLIITPPFWATWLAYTFYFLLGFGLLYSIRRFELNRTQLKNQLRLDEVKLEEKEEMDRMKSRFFANISHEFRTPLTLIMGPSEKLLAEEKNEITKKEAGLIKRNAARLLTLVNQLLDLSKLEAGKLKLRVSIGNIVSFVKGVTMSFESLANRNNIQLVINSEIDDMEIYFDKDKLAKILGNLLSNAFKFTQEGGQIIVSISSNVISKASPKAETEKSSHHGNKIFPKANRGRNDNIVSISVRDTGVGIPEEELGKLFDRFYQVDSSQTREHEGTGIGLALTKELVELHHGNIKVTSKIGEGSEFIVELPLGREQFNDDEIIEADVILSPAMSGINSAKNLSLEEHTLLEKKDSSRQKDWQASQTSQNDTIVGEDKNIILIIEDNTDVREYIKDSLGSGYRFEEAINGEEGLRKAQKIIPDLILSDIMMPKVDGNELSRRIKNDEKTSHIPVILLTAKSEKESKLEGLETGADDYLTKPFDTKELQARIKNLIEIRRKLQDKYGRGDFISRKRTDGRKLSSLEEKFMKKVIEAIEDHLSEEEFSVEQLGKTVGMDRVQMHRKLKALTGKSPSSYLRSVRLIKAKKMILEKKGNISEIAYSVGFSSPTYFTRCFKEEFGQLPSELVD